MAYTTLTKILLSEVIRRVAYCASLRPIQRYVVRGLHAALSIHITRVFPARLLRYNLLLDQKLFLRQTKHNIVPERGGYSS